MQQNPMNTPRVKAIEGLVVANVKDESARLELPRTFKRNIIPANRSEIPRPDVISRMSHLKDVSAELSPYMEDVEKEKLFTVESQIHMLYGRYSDGT